MVICKNLIKTHEIIGIGPLLVTPAKDLVESQMYNSQKLLFVVHTHHQSIEISSDWMKIGRNQDPNAQEAKEREKYKQFQKEYHEAEKAIRILIGENVEE